MTSHTLRVLLTLPQREQDPHLYAKHHAVFLLGPDVADAIRWNAHEEGFSYGSLTGTDETIMLRFEATEPGAERLEALVPCPTDPGCRNAYAAITGTHDLISILDGDLEAIDDRIDIFCDTHDDD